MKSSSVTLRADLRSGKLCFCSILPAASLLCILFLIVSAYISSDYRENSSSFWRVTNNLQNLKYKCMNQKKPYGSEPLPRGIVAKTSDLEMRPLWSAKKKPSVNLLKKKDANSSTSLFAMAVGIKQKDLVSKMVKKFLSSGFVVMLFHYDGIVDEWKEFQWSDQVIHVSAVSQTKWYISIVQKEGLEISQPALDYSKSEVHHQITTRLRGSVAHRRTYKSSNNGKGCYESSRAPPCTGWIEVMAPVFSRAAWRCVWYMIQNNLIHAWGLDMQIGYCAQANRTKKVGVVDAEYIIHHGRPTLGGASDDQNNQGSSSSSSKSTGNDHRVDVRRESFNQMKVFRRKWERAVGNDKCWIDPYK
ncbi:uncharacterized protein LOC126594540 isoform X4 [Malus sylvestris]|uniref:uncharacterized protein LOC126594540 isoform X4 n=1 Tax=Malus sylvestris TaxID=3752 RepID=UPI0021ACD679|nr:uncharacterized protein LOC126594540 isoform X4 [Malus sylvestris]